MTTSKVPVPTSFQKNHLQQDNHSLRCTLKWRQGQLLVRPEQQLLQVEKPNLPSLENEQWLMECLKHSPVRLVRIDPAVGEARLKFWASACEQASKPVFLRLSAAYALPSKRYPRSWWLKRLIDWSAGILLILVLSPVMLGLVCLMRIQSPEPVFCSSWCVGERGKLFRLFKFRTSVVNAQTLDCSVMGNQKSWQKPEDGFKMTLLGRWMHKYSLDELPQLLNVLRGEMSLVGPRPWDLHDVVGISPEGRVEINALPGIIAPLQSQASLNLLDSDAVNRCNLEYLRSWSLWQELKILLLTVAKIFSGFGAY